jgi:hypothetical protein
MLADGRSSKIVSDIVTNDPTKTTTNISINTATEIDSMTNMQTMSASN